MLARAESIGRRHRRLLTPLALLLGGAVVLLDCIVQQLLIDGAAAPGVAARWAASTLLPWAAAVYAIRRPIERGSPLARPVEAMLLVTALGLSVMLDLLLFRPELGLVTDALARVQSRLPIMLAVPLLARLGGLAGRPADAIADQLPTPLATALRGCRTCTAAGNYVEIDDGQRRRLVRATMQQAEATLGGDHVRIHRSVIVAWSLIERVERDRHGICGVRLSDGRHLPVGRAYRRRLRGR